MFRKGYQNVPMFAPNSQEQFRLGAQFCLLFFSCLVYLFVFTIMILMKLGLGF